ncbi:MAG: pyridoxal-phosphate dependent enzyme [Bacteriovoracaceae bacterium]
MMKGAKPNVLEAIGNTPIVKLNKISSEVESEIYVKLEFMNPGGSIKERIGKFILDRAVEEGKLKPGGTIIEGTSGNTGVGLAMWAAVNGYKCIFVLADKQSQEKINNLRAFGAKVIVCPTNVEPEDPRSYYSVSARLAETIPNSYFVNQYENMANSQTHFETTGPEIYEQTDGDFDVFMAGVGTGGTISGTGRYLKSVMPDVKVVGVDCEGSIVAHYAKTGEMGEARPYVLEGIGEDFIPGNYNFDVIDDWVMVGDKESFIMTRKLLTLEGIYTGGSAGAAVVGAIKYAKTLETPKKILVILPDSGNRYTSKIFNDAWMSDNDYKDQVITNVTIKQLMKDIGRDKEALIKISDEATIDDAIKLMDEKGVSQIPVFANNDVQGIIFEGELLKQVMSGQYSNTDQVSLVLNTNITTVHENELLSKVSHKLLKKEPVLVANNDGVYSILTDIDILRYISTVEY